MQETKVAHSNDETREEHTHNTINTKRKGGKETITFTLLVCLGDDAGLIGDARHWLPAPGEGRRCKGECSARVACRRRWG